LRIGTLSAGCNACQGKAWMNVALKSRHRNDLALALAFAGVLASGAFPAAAAPAAARSTGAAATELAPSPARPPADPTDVQGWLAYKDANELRALPYAARVVYRAGNLAAERDDFETAVRLWRGAEELDAEFLAPRLTLASHFLGRDPAQGLIEVARLLGLGRTSFRFQHFLATYAFFYAVSALFLATIAVALLLCWRHRHRLQHVYAELLHKRFAMPHASIWAWVLVALPFAFGFGLAVPAVFTLALLWSYLKKSERFVFGALVALLFAVPAGLKTFGDLSTPARPTEPPFYSTVAVEQEPYSEQRLAELEELAAAHPENPFLAYALGWMAERGRRYDEAVAAYARAAEAWPQEARIPNSLGNIEFQRGNAQGAESNYKKAIELAPRWAAPHYNLGQLFTARYRYAEASEEIATATALDFELVRALQARSASQAIPALASEWLEPKVQWQALFAGGSATTALALPPLWRNGIESRGLPIAIWAGVFAALGIALGLLLHHHLPARSCGNCGSTVCRRCATRRKDQILCVECASLAQNATTPEFGRLLLFKRRRETRRRQSHIRTAIAALIPGYGALAFDRVVTGWLIAAFAVLATLLGVWGAAPYPYDPRVLPGNVRPLAGVAFAALGLCYVVSLFVFWSLHTRAQEQEAERESVPARGATRLKRAA
jgi:tetratricopeptide (TPR) repeat protein